MLDKVRHHRKPISLGNIDILEHLDTKAFLEEISLIRATIEPNIKQKQRIKQGTGYRFLNFSDAII